MDCTEQENANPKRQVPIVRPRKEHIRIENSHHDGGIANATQDHNAGIVETDNRKAQRPDTESIRGVLGHL